MLDFVHDIYNNVPSQLRKLPYEVDRRIIRLITHYARECSYRCYICHTKLIEEPIEIFGLQDLAEVFLDLPGGVLCDDNAKLFEVTDLTGAFMRTPWGSSASGVESRRVDLSLFFSS